MNGDTHQARFQSVNAHFAADVHSRCVGKVVSAGFAHPARPRHFFLFVALEFGKTRLLVRVGCGALAAQEGWHALLRRNLKSALHLSVQAAGQVRKVLQRVRDLHARRGLQRVERGAHVRLRSLRQLNRRLRRVGEEVLRGRREAFLGDGGLQRQVHRHGKRLRVARPGTSVLLVHPFLSALVDHLAVLLLDPLVHKRRARVQAVKHHLSQLHLHAPGELVAARQLSSLLDRVVGQSRRHVCAHPRQGRRARVNLREAAGNGALVVMMQHGLQRAHQLGLCLARNGVVRVVRHAARHVLCLGLRCGGCGRVADGVAVGPRLGAEGRELLGLGDGVLQAPAAGGRVQAVAVAVQVRSTKLTRPLRAGARVAEGNVRLRRRLRQRGELGVGPEAGQRTDVLARVVGRRARDVLALVLRRPLVGGVAVRVVGPLLAAAGVVLRLHLVRDEHGDQKFCGQHAFLARLGKGRKVLLALLVLRAAAGAELHVARDTLVDLGCLFALLLRLALALLALLLRLLVGGGRERSRVRLVQVVVRVAVAVDGREDVLGQRASLAREVAADNVLPAHLVHVVLHQGVQGDVAHHAHKLLRPHVPLRLLAHLSGPDTHKRHVQLPGKDDRQPAGVQPVRHVRPLVREFGANLDKLLPVQRRAESPLHDGHEVLLAGLNLLGYGEDTLHHKRAVPFAEQTGVEDVECNGDLLSLFVKRLLRVLLLHVFGRLLCDRLLHHDVRLVIGMFSHDANEVQIL
eukprot:Rhum_TRINITY_DN14835_c0_g1::Rhum_TRINITY_DN14835_c0_g1_i1::g.123118::m.123118